MTVDHFGNLLTNLDASAVAQVPTPVVRAGGQEIRLRRTYSDVRPGDYVALINSFGVLEVARAEQSAAEGLGLGAGRADRRSAAPELDGRPAQRGNPSRPVRSDRTHRHDAPGHCTAKRIG